MKISRDSLKLLLGMIDFRKAFIFIVIPLVIAFYLFPPWEKITLPQDDSGEIVVTNEVFLKPSFRAFLADALQIPLRLNWYDVYILDKSVIHDERIQQPTLRLIFDKGSPEKYSKTSLKKWPDGTYEVPFGGEGYFTYLFNDDFTFRRMAIYGVEGYAPGEWDEHPFFTPEYKVYTKPYKPALVVKYILIFIFWFVFLSSFLNIWNSVKRKK